MTDAQDLAGGGSHTPPARGVDGVAVAVLAAAWVLAGLGRPGWLRRRRRQRSRQRALEAVAVGPRRVARRAQAAQRRTARRAKARQRRGALLARGMRRRAMASSARRKGTARRAARRRLRKRQPARARVLPAGADVLSAASEAVKQRAVLAADKTQRLSSDAVETVAKTVRR